MNGLFYLDSLVDLILIGREYAIMIEKNARYRSLCFATKYYWH